MISSPLAARLYAVSVPYVHIGQTLAWLEVLHTISGLAGGGVATAVVQSLGRYITLVFLIEPISFIQLEWVSITLFISWALADVVRYMFYITTLLNIQAPMLKWVRYTSFIVLQPVGISSEWYVYWRTLDYIDATHMYAVRMPNKLNFAFDFGIWNRGVLLAYFYFGPMMILHMVRQRRAKLSGQRSHQRR